MKSLLQNKTSIYLADDHQILREGLKLVIESKPNLKVIGEASDGLTAFKEIMNLKPDVAILDISMPEMNGIQVAKNLKDSHTKVIILSSYDSKEYIKESLKQKVFGYILKEDAGKELHQAIESALQNKLYLSERIKEQELDEDFNLTDREISTLKLIADGKSNKDISKILDISESTAKVHRTNLMNKLGIHKATDLVKFAIENKII